VDGILYGGDDIEGDLEAIFINPVASIIPKWNTFKLVRCVELLKRLEDLEEILY
jgi:hypothetical protein